MTDKPKCSIVGLDRKAIDPNSLKEDVEPNPYLIEILENMLEAAKSGYMQEMIAVCYQIDGEYSHGVVVDVANYSPAYRGHLMEAADNYREMHLDYMWEMEE